MLIFYGEPATCYSSFAWQSQSDDNHTLTEVRTNHLVQKIMEQAKNTLMCLIRGPKCSSDQTIYFKKKVDFVFTQ